jgi:lipopolysaccharide/colanic/teichoic acid biosynthesis glycosyltransferase
LTNNKPAGGLPRIVEVSAALVAMLFAGPVLIICAALLKIFDRGPIIFRQRRVGRHGNLFVLYKLRTMRPGPERQQVTAGGDARITPVGRFLRKTKLDEFPEFWNVIKGDMALVGPRPEVPRYVDQTDERWRLVLAARPGITDPTTLWLRNEEKLLAGIKGDPEAFYLEMLQPLKLAGYLEYLNRRTWRTDLDVIWRTLLVVAAPGRAPTEKVREHLSVTLALEAPPQSQSE